MQRFTRILFVNDPAASAETALRRAVQLARTNTVQLTIVDVREGLPRSLANLEEAFVRLQEERLKSLAQKIASDAFNVRTKPLTGTPFLEIIKQVARGRHDLVIKPAEGRGGVSSRLFGSTDLHLLRKCPCPVWIVKLSKRKKYSRVLVAVDPDPGQKANAELNALILDLATSVAQREKSELHIVHAWAMSYESTLRSGRIVLPKAEVDRLVRATRKVHKKWLDELLGHYDLDNLSAKVHLLKGDAGDVIPALAQKKRVELIIMGTVARTGIPGFFIGNTAERIVAAADCSVLTVKPKAFLTPVRS